MGAGWIDVCVLLGVLPRGAERCRGVFFVVRRACATMCVCECTPRRIVLRVIEKWRGVVREGGVFVWS